jgi:hypothetical protein
VNLFEGTKKDLERLDALHLAAWQTAGVSLEWRGQLTRVDSAGRVHAWPGDPDDVAAAIGAIGYRARLVPGPGGGFSVEVLGR